MANDIKVTINKTGVVQLCKSSGVKSFLESEVSKACSRCNSMYSGSKYSVSPYGYNVEEHTHTAVGRIYTKTKFGKLDNARNNTLKKATGW